jgi:tRNA pseudouridine55 synthase
MNGVLIIDKPAGLTSHDVVNRVRRILQQKSVGHLGTLDPAATGVLPLVLGNLTRLAQFYTGCEKTYEGVIRFGFATDTYDAEGEPAGLVQPVSLSDQQVREVASHFRGVIEQMPPPFSAKKIKGVPAYKLARKHQDVPLQPVQVEIKEFEILRVESDRVSFRARVASGTYMRSVAHDMGQQIGCGAHLESLRRTALGEFTVADAHTLEQVAAAARDGQSESILVHPRQLLPHIPSVTATEEAAALIRAGRAVNLMELSGARQVKVFYGQRDLIAIATRIAGTLFHPKIVLVTDPAPQLAKPARK